MTIGYLYTKIFLGKYEINFYKNYKSNLYFVLVPENEEEKIKRKKIENALNEIKTPIEIWKEFAISEYGLINGSFAFYGI